MRLLRVRKSSFFSLLASSNVLLSTEGSGAFAGGGGVSLFSMVSVMVCVLVIPPRLEAVSSRLGSSDSSTVKLTSDACL